MVGKEGGHKIQQMVFRQFDKSMRKKKENANCYQQQEADIASERVLDSNTKLLISFLLLLYIHLAHTHSDTRTPGSAAKFSAAEAKSWIPIPTDTFLSPAKFII